MAGDARARTLRRERIAVGGTYLIQGVMFAALLTQVPVLQERFRFSDAALTGVLFAVPVVAGLGSVLAGLVAERLGSAIVLRVAQPVLCLSVLACGLVPDRAGLYVALAAFGLAVGACDAGTNMQGTSLQRRYGRSILGSFYAVWSVAGIAGALISSGTEHWRLPLWAGFGAAAAIGLTVSLAGGGWLVRREVEHRVPEAVGGAAAPAVRWRPIVLIGLPLALMYIADSATSNFSAEYLRHGLSSGGTFAAWGYAAYQACMLLGRAASDRAVVRFGPVRTVRAGAVLGALGLLLSVLAPGAVAGIVGFAVLGLGLAAVVPQVFSAADRHDPGGSGLAVSRVNLFNYLGFLVGAPLVGGVASASTWRIGFAAVLVVVIAIVPLARVLGPGGSAGRSAGGEAGPAQAVADPGAVPDALGQ